MSPCDSGAGGGGGATTDDALVIAELAALNPLEYDRCRKEKAKELGLRPSVLDKLVKLARKALHRQTRHNHKRNPALVQVVTGDIDLSIEAAERVLWDAKAPIYQRGTFLVRPGWGKARTRTGAEVCVAHLQRLNAAGLIEELAKVAEFQVPDGEGGWTQIDPPMGVALGLLARNQWNLPTVAGIITCPTLRPDGSLLTAPGYDAATKLYHLADPGLALPAVAVVPTRSDALEALALLCGLLHGFPFVTQDDRAVGLSLMLSAAARGALEMVPIHVLDAPTPGTGKSYVLDVVSTIITGRPQPVLGFGRDNEEFEKRIAACIIEGDTIVSIDNVTRPLGGEALNRVTSQPIVAASWAGRSG
jgi:putative DNA primase/helicase